MSRRVHRRRGWGLTARRLLRPEVYEYPPEVVGVLLDTVVECLDLLLVEESQHTLLELAAPLAGDDLHQSDLLLHRLVDGGSQGTINVVAPVVDLVQIELELHGRRSTPADRQRWVGAFNAETPQNDSGSVVPARLAALDLN